MIYRGFVSLSGSDGLPHFLCFFLPWIATMVIGFTWNVSESLFKQPKDVQLTRYRSAGITPSCRAKVRASIRENRSAPVCLSVCLSVCLNTPWTLPLSSSLSSSQLFISLTLPLPLSSDTCRCSGWQTDSLLFLLDVWTFIKVKSSYFCCKPTLHVTL